MTNTELYKLFVEEIISFLKSTDLDDGFALSNKDANLFIKNNNNEIKQLANVMYNDLIEDGETFPPENDWIREYIFDSELFHKMNTIRE